MTAHQPANRQLPHREVVRRNFNEDRGKSVEQREEELLLHLKLAVDRATAAAVILNKPDPTAVHLHDAHLLMLANGLSLLIDDFGEPAVATFLKRLARAITAADYDHDETARTLFWQLNDKPAFGDAN